MLNSSFQWAASFSLAVFLTMSFVDASHADPTAPVQNDPAQFARGAKAWANNCASCHNRRPANDLRDDQWRVVVAHMRVRGDLTGQEARDVLKFLQGSN